MDEYLSPGKGTGHPRKPSAAGAATGSASPESEARQPMEAATAESAEEFRQRIPRENSLKVLAQREQLSQADSLG